MPSVTILASGRTYWSMSPGIVAESDLSGNLQHEYVFFDGERVARRDLPSGAVSYYFSDNLQTASVITNSAGTITEDEDFYPWGGEVPFVNSDSNHYKFGGHERDTETGLDYMLARYYSNPLGRFLSADWAAKPITVPYANFGNPQSLNLYTFGKNNPRTFGDPDGHCPGDECSKVTVTVTAETPSLLLNAKTAKPDGSPGYVSGAGTVTTIKLEKNGKPMAGVAVKESPTTKDNLSKNAVPNQANPETKNTSDAGTIHDVVMGVITPTTSQPQNWTAEDKTGMTDVTTSEPYSRTTDQTLTFSTGGQTCTCTYSETLSNVDSNGNLNQTKNPDGTNMQFSNTNPTVTKAPKPPTDHKNTQN